MTEPESNPPELTPAQADAVRRHLASARHTEPMPDAVAERLDRVLVGLASERKPAPSDHPAVRPVSDLAARRRWRRGAQLLVAAAAVVVAGVGLSQLPGPSSDDDAGGGSASSAQDNSAMERGPSGGPDDKPLADASPTGPDQPEGGDVALSRLPVIRPDHFRADVARPHQLAAETTADYSLAKRIALRASCPVAAKGERTLVVTYAGALAELIYRTPTDDGQRVDLYRCEGRDGTSGYVRSVVLPSP